MLTEQTMTDTPRTALNVAESPTTTPACFTASAAATG
jgi:hypothetical protein